MAKLVTRPQRFTPEEWQLASKVKHKNTERDRAATERLILECDRLDGEGRGTVDRTLADVNKKLGKTRFTVSIVTRVFLVRRSTVGSHQELERGIGSETH